LSKELAADKGNPYEPILQKATQNLQKLKTSLSLKQQFLQEMGDVLLRETHTYKKCSTARHRLQEQSRTLVRRSSHSEGFIYDKSRVEKIKQQFMLSFEEIKSELLGLSSEVTRVKLEAQSYVAVLSDFGKKASAHQLLQLCKEKETDVIILLHRFFKENSAHILEAEDTVSLQQQTKAPERSTQSARFLTEEQLLAKLQVSMNRAENWLLEETEVRMQEISNLSSTVSQIEFKLSGKLEKVQVDPAKIKEDFAHIVESIVKSDETFYEKYLFCFGYFLALEDRCLNLHYFIMSGLLHEALENLLFATKSEGYLQSLLLGVDRPGCLEPIENFLDAYRTFIFASLSASLRDYQDHSTDPESSQVSLAELLAPNYRRLLVAADSAKERINLYLDSLKSERNKNWLCYSISTQYLPRVMDIVCPLLLKIEEYR
jgi:hypothetical protein